MAWPQFFRAASAVLGTNTQLVKNATQAALASGKLDGNATAKAAAEGLVTTLTKQMEVFELRTGAFMRSEASLASRNGGWRADSMGWLRQAGGWLGAARAPGPALA